MIESPVLQQWRAEAIQGMIIEILKDRFGGVPRDVTKPFREITDEKKLKKLGLLATKCSDVEAFRKALLS